MSKNFLLYTKKIFGNNSFPDIKDIKLKLNISAVALLMHGVYAYTTKKEIEIKVLEKYTFTRGGYTEFMIIDTNGNHYNLNNSFWYLKFDSIEDFYNINVSKNNSIKFLCYGYRIPILGIFPNIVRRISLEIKTNKKNELISEKSDLGILVY